MTGSKVIPLFCILFLIVSLLSAGDAQRRPMTVDDALNIVNLSDVAISPNGQWVFFAKSELDWDKNKYEKKYYMILANGGE
ncbi:MAG: hypothetical protein MUF15_21370, partial [Acidobacteria bacterium]|nr:hypothetical protein [Acidobacteriota bacterium]